MKASRYPAISFTTAATMIRVAQLALVSLALDVLLVAGSLVKKETTEAAYIDALVEGNNKFGMDLFRSLPKGENHLIAPWSLTAAFAMLYLGARGLTAKEMEEVIFAGKAFGEDLHQSFQAISKQLESGSYDREYSCVNSILVQEGLDVNPDYLQQLWSLYHATVYDVDFAAGDEQRILKFINAWTELRTNGKFTAILDQPPSRETRLMLLNSIYFYGQWQTQFDPRNTTLLPFYNYGKKNPNPAPFMTVTANVSAGYHEASGTRILELPYTGNSATMLLLMPRHSEYLHELLDPELLEQLLATLEPEILQITLLKFNIKKSYRPKDILLSMGLKRVFSANEADISGVSKTAGLYLNEVIHQVAVDVREEGTEASAATALDVTSRTTPPRLIFDHPFLFLIRDTRSKVILFIGTITHV